MSETPKPAPLSQWSERGLVALALFELLNLFAIVVTAGALSLLPLSDRFASFRLHALLAFLFLAAWTALRARGLPGAEKRYHLARLAIVALCLFGAGLYFRYGTLLGADGPHYYIQARSLLFDLDLDFENDYERVKAYLPMPERAIGISLLSIPFLLASHLLLLLGNALGRGWEADGFGYAYEAAFGVTTLVFGSLGLLSMLATVRRFFGTGVALFSVVTVAVSSFFAWYLIVEPAMPHVLSATFGAFFVAYWTANRPLEDARRWVVLGLLGGAFALMRWQNVVLLALPLIDHLFEKRRLEKNFVWMGAAAFLAFTPQLFAFAALAGSPFVDFERHGVRWAQLGVAEILFSTNRGLFPWSPVVYLALAGLLVWATKATRLALLCLFGFALQVYINASVDMWWGGWAFGGRRFDNCVVFFALGFAALVELLRRRPGPLLAGLAAVLVLWNVGLARHSMLARVPPDKNVSFERIAEENLELYYPRLGYPAAWPVNWWFAWRHAVTPDKFDGLFGHVGFGNLRTSFDPESELFLASGFEPAERDPAGRWFRWATGAEARLLVPLREPRRYRLSLELRPFPGATPNRIGLRVNGASQASFELSEAGIVEWVLPPALWRPGVNELRFDFARAARPSDIAPRSEDSRELAAAFYRMELVSTDP